MRSRSRRPPPESSSSGRGCTAPTCRWAAARWPSRRATSPAWRSSWRPACRPARCAMGSSRRTIGPASASAMRCRSPRPRRSIGLTLRSPASRPIGAMAPTTRICPPRSAAPARPSRAAMDDDLGVSAALAAVFELVRDVNRRIATRSLSTADAATGAGRALRSRPGPRPPAGGDRVSARRGPRRPAGPARGRPWCARLGRLGSPAGRAGRPRDQCRGLARRAALAAGRDGVACLSHRGLGGRAGTATDTAPRHGATNSRGAARSDPRPDDPLAIRAARGTGRSGPGRLPPAATPRIDGAGQPPVRAPRTGGEDRPAAIHPVPGIERARSAAATALLAWTATVEPTTLVARHGLACVEPVVRGAAGRSRGAPGRLRRHDPGSPAPATARPRSFSGQRLPPSLPGSSRPAARPRARPAALGGRGDGGRRGARGRPAAGRGGVRGGPGGPPPARWRPSGARRSSGWCSHATALRIPIVEVEGGTLTATAGFDGHQGVALVVAARRFAAPGRDPRPGHRARRAAVRARPGFAGGPAEPGLAPPQRRGRRGRRRPVPAPAPGYLSARQP